MLGRLWRGGPALPMCRGMIERGDSPPFFLPLALSAEPVPFRALESAVRPGAGMFPAGAEAKTGRSSPFLKWHLEKQARPVTAWQLRRETG